jgi:hypothetical protein
MKELFLYIVAIILVLYIVFVALNTLNTYYPNLYEGLENAGGNTSSTSTTTPTPVTEVMPVTGVGSTSQLYAQTLTTAISSLETELGMDAYSQQYLSIIDNLKILYKQRALKTALQTPTQNDKTNNMMPLYLYGQNIQTLDMLEDFIRSKKKSMW